MVGIVQLGLRNHSGFYAQSLGPDQCIGISLVADDEGAVDTFRATEILDEILTVGAASRHKDGNIHFIYNLTIYNFTIDFSI